MSKIVELTAENVKRLKAVHIKPDGSIVQITGRNAQGKTSVLDAIAMALGGKDAVPDVPVRRGASKAKIVCKLDDLIVTRTFTAEGGTTLTVTSHDGSKYPGPQSMLDSLVGKLAFDPLAFARMDAKKQLETLKSVVGLNFFDLDRKRATLFEDRTIAGREAKSLEAQLKAMPFHADAGDKEVSVQDLMSELDRAEAENRKVQKSAQEIEDRKLSHEQLGKTIAQLQEELAGLVRQYNDETAEIAALDKSIDKMSLVDVTPIKSAIANADTVNRKVRENQRRGEIYQRSQVADECVAKLTESINSIDQQKRDTLSAAKFPVEGLSFDDNGVMYRGMPFSQASSAEQLRVSVAMGLAMNPKLRVLLIRDGSLLDESNMEMIAEMAAQHDAQIWIERVADGENVGVVIEDGSVAAVAATA